MNIQITGLYASIMALYFIGLTFWVIKGRWKYSVALGTGESKDLTKRVRVHGNFAEFIPLCLLMIGISEMNGFASWAIHGFGVTLIASRVLHTVGLAKSIGTSFGRITGTASMLILLATCSVINILKYFGVV